MKLQQFLLEGYLEAFIGGNALVENPLKDELYWGENITSIRFCGKSMHLRVENREIRSLITGGVLPHGVYSPLSPYVEWIVRPKDLGEAIDSETNEIGFEKFDGGRCVLIKFKVN